MASPREPFTPRAAPRQRTYEHPTASNHGPGDQALEPSSRAFPRRLIESLPAALLVVTPDLKVVFANDALYNSLGLRNKSIEGKHLPGVLRLDGVEQLLDAVLKGNKPLLEQEVIYLHPRKGHRWLRISASQLREENGHHTADEDTLLVLSLDDVTARRQAQEKLQETSRLISLGELIAGVAHEINNPLTSIMGFAQLIMERGPEEPSRQEMMEIIFSEAQRVSKVVHNLLSFSRQYKAEKAPVDVPSIVERVLALKAYELRVSNVEVETRFPPDLPKAYADEHHLEQVFLNIVTNAEQAMAETHRKGRLTVLGLETQEAVRVSFYDNGPGIHPNSLNTIFKPFITTKAPGQGTGLGLSICKTLVQEHGGRIWAESELGKGAVFHVEIPAPQR